MKKKILFGCLVIFVIVTVFFQIIKPIWIIPKNDIICKKDSGFVEYFPIWLEDESVRKNFCDISEGFPSSKSEDYRQLIHEFEITSTSLLNIKKIVMSIDEISCDEKNNVIFSSSHSLEELEISDTKFGKKLLYTPPILVFVGDLNTEDEIKERIERIAKATKYKLAFDMSWVGVKDVSFTFDNPKEYYVEDGDTGEKEKLN